MPTTIVVGGVIEKDGKYLLVQEAKEKIRGKWCIPAGHLEPNETLFEGAKREIKKESGFDVELTGLCQICDGAKEGKTIIIIVFTAKILGGEIKIDPSEILDVKWFTYAEIVAMKDQLRDVDLILGAIDNTRNALVAPTEIIEVLRR